MGQTANLLLRCLNMESLVCYIIVNDNIIIKQFQMYCEGCSMPHDKFKKNKKNMTTPYKAS